MQYVGAACTGALSAYIVGNIYRSDRNQDQARLYMLITTVVALPIAVVNGVPLAVATVGCALFNYISSGNTGNIKRASRWTFTIKVTAFQFPTGIIALSLTAFFGPTIATIASLTPYIVFCARQMR